MMKQDKFYIAQYQDDVEHVFKFGITDNIDRRMNEHSRDTGAYTDIVARKAWVMKDALAFEQTIKKLTYEWRTSDKKDKKEWRYCDCMELVISMAKMACKEEITLEDSELVAEVPVRVDKTRGRNKDLLTHYQYGHVFTNDQHPEEKATFVEYGIDPEGKPVKQNAFEWNDTIRTYSRQAFKVLEKYDPSTKWGVQGSYHWRDEDGTLIEDKFKMA
jgi:predicted GIY-YIG superfamily endonuclease